jgi:hypothetical protein
VELAGGAVALTEIKQAIKSGKAVPGVELVKGTYLKIK